MLIVLFSFGWGVYCWHRRLEKGESANCCIFEPFYAISCCLLSLFFIVFIQFDQTKANQAGFTDRNLKQNSWKIIIPGELKHTVHHDSGIWRWLLPWGRQNVSANSSRKILTYVWAKIVINVLNDSNNSLESSKQFQVGKEPRLIKNSGGGNLDSFNNHQFKFSLFFFQSNLTSFKWTIDQIVASEGQ